MMLDSAPHISRLFPESRTTLWMRPSEQPAGELSKLLRYQVLKLISSGDYICCDKMGKNYLLVSQPANHKSEFEFFSSSIRNHFHRNQANRALLTPFEDVSQNGLLFTVYMLPDKATCIMSTSETHFKS
jgi:hypothetical protein